MAVVGAYIIPVTVMTIVVFGLIKKVPVFDVFLQGAKEGVKSTVAILPSLIGLIVGVTMLNASGVFTALAELIAPIAQPLGFPQEVLPMALLRPISGSGSIAILNDLLTQYGAESFIGRVAAVMMGSTETTFYAITVYYGSVGIKQIRHTLPAALLADFAGMIMAVLSVRWLFG